MTPADRLRAMAEEEEKRAAELEAGLEDIKAAIANHRAGAAGMRKLADGMDGTRDTLTAAVNAVKVNVNKPVTDEHRFNIARGQKRGDKFLQAITKADFTQKTLSEKLGIAPALLSMYRQGKRPIPRERAEEIERLTGWKATARNWPGNIVS